MAFLMKAAEVFRDFVTWGVPSSGKWEPKKSDIRAWGTWVEEIIGAFFSTGGKIYQTRALLNADLSPAANSIAWVMEDPTVANNGIYRKVGGTGTGSWVRAGDLPLSFIVASNPGAGTPNAIQATTSVPLSSSALVILPIAVDNTASPVTVSFNSGPALTIKTNSGIDVDAGGLRSGMVLMGSVSGSTFRLFSDDAVAAQILEARDEVASYAADAQSARDLAQSYAEDAATVSGVFVPIFSSVASASAANIVAGVRSLRTNFRAPDFSAPATLSGGARYRRISFAALFAYPTQSYFRSQDRFMPDGTIDNANGGYWVIDEHEISVDMLGAIGDGATDDTVGIQAALNHAGITKGKVTARGKTYIISSIIVIPAGVTLDGQSVAVFTQKNGTGLPELFNLSSNAKLISCVIDGNRPGNVDNGNHVAVRIGTSNDCLVESCTVKNCTGFGIVVNEGLRARIAKNKVFNFYNIGIAAFGNNSAHAHDIDGNEIHTIGWSGIFLQHSDYVRAKNNVITGKIIGTRENALVVSTTGVTVTRVSGPSFSSLMKGNFVVINSGQEYRISSVDSANQLTVEAAMPTLNNVPASCGSGDLLGVTASNFCDISENNISFSATFLFGFSLGFTAVQCGNNVFARNTLNFGGKNAINLNAAVGAGFLDNNSITENKVFNAGFGLGLGVTDRIAIFLASGSPGKLNNTYIANNTIISYGGAGQTAYWLGTDGQLSFGAVSVGGNKPIDIANKGVFGDIVTIALSSGWGSNALVSSITSHGDQVIFTISCAGSGFLADPELTVQKIVDCSNDPPLPTAKIVSASGGAGLSAMWGEQLSIRGQWKSKIAGTPAGGHAYTIMMKAA